MSIVATFSLLILQVTTANPVMAAASPDTGPVFPPSFDLVLRAIVIWIAFVAFCVGVFAYRRKDDLERKGFEDEYQKKLEAMRRGSHD